MKRGLLIGLISLLLLLLAGGVAVYFLARKFKKPEIVSMQQVISPGENGIATGTNILVLKNPNPFSLRVDSLRYAMSIKGQTYLRGHRDQPVELKANSIDTVELPFKAAGKKMREDFPTKVREQAKVEVEGYVSVWKFRRVHVRFPYSPEIAFFRPPELVKQESFHSFDSTGRAKVAIKLLFANPNKYPVRADSLKVSLHIDGKEYHHAPALKSVKFGPLDTQWVTLPLTYESKEFERRFRGRDSAMHRFVFDLLLTTPEFQRRHITVILERMMPVITKFSIEMEDIQLKKLSLPTAHLSLRLKITNPNARTFRLTGLNYNVRVEGRKWASGALPGELDIPANSTVKADLPVTLRLDALTENAKDYFEGNKMQEYDLRARIVVRRDEPKLPDIEMHLSDTRKLAIRKFLEEKDVIKTKKEKREKKEKRKK